MSLYAYSRSPIDFWPGWLTEQEYKAQLSSRYYGKDDAVGAWAAYEAFRDAGLALARKVGWEGDIRQGPFVAGLPTKDIGDDGNVLVAWKQSNNGSTFVVSPYRLPWVEEDASSWTRG